VEVNATSSPLVCSISVRISSDVTPGGDRATVLDAEQVEDIDEDVELFTVIRTMMNPRKCVKKCESQIGELDKLKLKVVVPYEGIGKEIHMTQSVGFVAADSVSVD